MSARNFNRKFNMNVNDVIQDNIPDTVYSSILFTLVNLPYRDNSLDIEDISIEGADFKCYKNHYRFKNDTMTIIKVASKQFVPYGLYARKIINYLIANYSYKKGLPDIYGNETSQRMVYLGKKPLDFVEKICGSRNPGTRKKIILKQLEAILNCYMAIATGYQQINPKDDEALASDKFQFALIESVEGQLINHKFDVFNNWQEKVYVSIDLARIMSKHIMPLDKNVYDKITSPMELDIYQYYMYQNYNCLKRCDDNLLHDWEEEFSLFGRGYAKTSQGMADFRRDFRKNLEVLKTKVHLQISAPLDKNYIIFTPSPELVMLQESSSSANLIVEREYIAYKDVLDTLPQMGGGGASYESKWQDFVREMDLIRKFDTNAVNYIKTYFEKDADNTKKTIKFVLSQESKKPSAFVKKALSESWVSKNDIFNQRLVQWKAVFERMSCVDMDKCRKFANNALDFLKTRYHPEEFSKDTLVLIYARLYQDGNTALLLDELNGSKYQQHFRRHHELFQFFLG